MTEPHTSPEDGHLPNLDDDTEGMCPMCGEYPWGPDECGVCGAWEHDHVEVTDHDFEAGDGKSPHPHDFRFPSDYGESEST